MATPKDVIAMAKEHGAQIVDLRFTDLPGQVQHLSLPVHELTEEKLTEGQPFDGSFIRGFQQIQESDMLLFPDPDTAFIDPFTKHPTLNIICDVKDPLTREDYSRDPRNIAKKAELYLKQTGIADTSYFGPEAEFYIFDASASTRTSSSGYYFTRRRRGRLEHRPRWRGRQPGLQAPLQGRLLPAARRWTSIRTCAPRWC